MLWDLSIIADRLHAAVQSAEDELRLEQAVKGLDNLSELAIQELLARSLSNEFSVHREVHYPSSVGSKLSHRKRCDLVLAPSGKPLRLDSAPPTLFDPPEMTSPEEVLWLEVKVAYQFREGNVRHGGYGQQWRSAVIEDLKKMEAESRIHEAVLVLIVFTESIEIIEKDLQLFEDILVRKEVLAGFRQVRSVKVLDRIGHNVCNIAVYPTIQRGVGVGGEGTSGEVVEEIE